MCFQNLNSTRPGIDFASSQPARDCILYSNNNSDTGSQVSAQSFFEPVYSGFQDFPAPTRTDPSVPTRLLCEDRSPSPAADAIRTPKGHPLWSARSSGIIPDRIISVPRRSSTHPHILTRYSREHVRHRERCKARGGFAVIRPPRGFSAGLAPAVAAYTRHQHEHGPPWLRRPHFARGRAHGSWRIALGLIQQLARDPCPDPPSSPESPFPLSAQSSDLPATCLHAPHGRPP